MLLLFLRRMVELFIFSVIPGFLASMLIQVDSIQGILFYPVLLVISLVCSFIFFGGNALMMRRMVRDIESKEKYQFVQWMAFAIYTVFLICVCVFGWKDARASFLFHSRVFEVMVDPIVIDATDRSKNLLTPTQSMIISTILYGLLTAFSYKWFYNAYQNEQKEKKLMEEAEYEAAKEARRKHKEEQEKRERALRDGTAKREAEEMERELRRQAEERREKRRQRMQEEENKLYSIKELKRMERMGDLDRMSSSERRPRRRRSKANSGEKLKANLLEMILEAGSYEFYRRFIEKQESGDDAWGFARNHWKRRFTLGVSLRQTRRMK